jgi:uncharacterized membrane protein HdeD (DUF308 family)
MKGIIKKIKNKLTDRGVGLAVGVLLAIMGVALLLFPGESLTTACAVLGVGVIVLSVIRFVKYFNDKKEDKETSKTLFSGILFLIIAFVLLMHPKFLLSVFPFLIGLAVVCYGVASFFGKPGVFGKIFAVITVVLGASLIINPFHGATKITSMVGFVISVVGVAKVVSEIMNKKKPLISDGTDEDGYREVEFKDVD